MKTFRLLIAVICLSLLPVASSWAQTLQRINPPGLAKPNGYSHVVVAQGGRTVYVSGQVPLTADGKLVGAGDMEAQTRQVFKNLETALVSARASFKDVVKINIYITDVSKLDSVRKVRNEYLPSDFPASTLTEVKALFRPDVLVEIDAIAVSK